MCSLAKRHPTAVGAGPTFMESDSVSKSLRVGEKLNSTWSSKTPSGVRACPERSRRVDILYWSKLHASQAHDTPFGVLRVCVHLERERPPQPLWLGWQGPAWPLYVLWRYYQLRWPIEPSIRCPDLSGSSFIGLCLTSKVLRLLIAGRCWSVWLNGRCTWLDLW